MLSGSAMTSFANEDNAKVSSNMAKLLHISSRVWLLFFFFFFRRKRVQVIPKPPTSRNSSGSPATQYAHKPTYTDNMAALDTYARIRQLKVYETLTHTQITLTHVRSRHSYTVLEDPPTVSRKQALCP